MTTFFLHLLACFAEEERRQISERTKAALKVAKSRGTPLGRHATLLASERRENRRKFALENAETLNATMIETGSLSATARLLNERKVSTANGGKWHPQTVKNYLRMIDTVPG